MLGPLSPDMAFVTIRRANGMFLSGPLGGCFSVT